MSHHGIIIADHNELFNNTTLSNTTGVVNASKLVNYTFITCFNCFLWEVKQYTPDFFGAFRDLTAAYRTMLSDVASY